MSLADTAKLLASLDLQDLFSPKAAKAGLAIGGLEKKFGTLGAVGGITAKGLGNLGRNIEHLAFTAAAGLGVGGLLSVGGALQQGISKAEQFGEAVDKAMSITGLGVDKASALASALAYVGIDADSTIKALGMAEKNLGALTLTTAKATEFQKSYGLSLVDSNGKAVDANELLLRTADYFNNALIPASTKATALSQIFGRSWTNLVEVLEMGRDKLAAAEQTAKDLGLTMTQDNVGAFVKFRDASRDAQTALGGMELQLGLLVMPDIANGMKTFTDYVRTHQDDIKQFFANGLQTAKEIGAFITGSVIPAISTIANVAKTIWDQIPAPMQQMLAGGFVLNKLTGGAVTDLVEVLGKGLIKGVLGMNAAVVNVNAAVVNGPGGIPGVPGAPVPKTGTPPAGGPLSGIQKLFAGFLGGGAAVFLSEDEIQGAWDRSDSFLRSKMPPTVSGSADIATAGGGALRGFLPAPVDVTRFADASLAAAAAGMASGAPKLLAASKDLGWNVLNGFLGPLQFSADKVVEIFRTGFFSGGVAGIMAAAKSTGAAGMEALASAIVADRQKPLDAMDALTQMLKTSLTPSKEAARIAGQLTSKTLAEGLNDGRADVRAQAIGTYQDLLSRLGALRDATGSIGKAAMDALREGMKNKNPEIAKTAHDAMVVLMTGLADRASQATPAGQAAMDALVQGLKDKDPDIAAAAQAAIAIATAALLAGVPAANAAGQANGWAFIAGMTGVINAQTGFITGSVPLPTTPYRPPSGSLVPRPTPVTVHVTTAPASARQNQQAAVVTGRWGGGQKQ